MVCSDTRFFSELKFWVCLVGSCWHLTMWLLLEFISMSPSHSFTPYGYWFCVSSYQRKFEGTSVLRIWWPRWNGMEWIRMDSNGMESNGMDWNGMDWNGMEWHGMAQKLPVSDSDFEGSLARKLRFHIFSIQILREVSHESFVSTFVSTFHFHFWKEVSHESCVFTSSTLKFQGSLALKLRFHIFHFHFLRDVSHESFGFTSSTLRFWRKSRTKASFSHLQLSDFEEILARKLRFHIFNSRILKEVSHESFGFHLQILKEVSHKTHESCGFTSSTFRFWGNSRTKAALSHLELLEFEGSLAWELRFHIFHLQISREVSHESFAFSHLQLSDFEGRLARKLRFHIFHFRFWRKSRTKRTKASVSHLPLSDFEGILARKLRYHILNCWNLKEVSHESFAFTSSTFRFRGKSRTKASLSHTFNCPILRDVSHESFGFTSSTSDFEGSLAQNARKLRFHIFHFQILREFSHESCVFTPWTVGIWRESRMRASLLHLPPSDFEGSLARKLRFLTSSTVGFWGKSRTKCMFER